MRGIAVPRAMERVLERPEGQEEDRVQPDVACGVGVEVVGGMEACAATIAVGVAM